MQKLKWIVGLVAVLSLAAPVSAGWVWQEPSKADSVEIVCILDRSGSMQDIKSDAIGGFNSFLEQQKKLPGEAYLTLILFNDLLTQVHLHTPIGGVKPLTEGSYVPAESTALLDAIGKTIHCVAGSIGDNRRVIVAILTDGLENASTEFTRQEVFDLIDEKKDKKWEFLFLAANQDAIQSGTSIGITWENCTSFTADSVGVSNVFGGIDAAVTGFREEDADSLGELTETK